MIKTAIFIPISRANHLDRLFHSLEVLGCDNEQTTLLTYVDGDRRLFELRTLTQASKFKDATCVMRTSAKPGPLPSLVMRRYRIASIKNESRDLIPDCEYVFSIEDDTIVPPHALTNLLIGYAAYPYAGFIEGVELGRWGVPYVGAWRADDVYEPSKIESAIPSQGIEEIDAGGFYCYVTKRDTYIKHEYKPFGNNDLGPDVQFGIYLRQQGFKNYIDWGVNCEHITRGGASLSLANTASRQAAMVKQGDTWQQKLA